MNQERTLEGFGGSRGDSPHYLSSPLKEPEKGAWAAKSNMIFFGEFVRISVAGSSRSTTNLTILHLRGWSLEKFVKTNGK